MKAILICPADRTSTAFLARTCPLALVPIFGRSLLDLWLSDLANRGARKVLILAADRPDKVRAHVGRGEQWGLQVEVQPDTRELTPDAALAKHRPAAETDWLPAPYDATLLDHVPGSSIQLWNTPADWFAELQKLMPAAAADRVGMRELAPGVFVHVRSRIDPAAHLTAPCWIGANSWIAALSKVGPDAVVEEGSYVDDGASVHQSLVGSGTYVGSLTELNQSLAWGRGLYKWTNGSFTEVTDQFLLADIDSRARTARSSSLACRFLALLALAATSPVLLWALLRRSSGRPLFELHIAVRAPQESEAISGTLRYHTLNGVGPCLRRWPQLWSIAKGSFCWVGNRPLTPDQASQLSNEFERLWLAVPTGWISLADAEGCIDRFDDEARAHSSFYAVQSSTSQNLRLLARGFGRLFNSH
jgi:Bacterial sugar transferase